MGLRFSLGFHQFVYHLALYICCYLYLMYHLLRYKFYLCFGQLLYPLHLDLSI